MATLVRKLSSLVFVTLFLSVQLTALAEENQQVFAIPLSVVVTPWDMATSNQSAAAARIYQAYNEISNGILSFSAASANYHNGARADVLVIHRSNPLFKSIAYLQPGDISQVLNYDGGYAIFKRVLSESGAEDI